MSGSIQNIPELLLIGIANDMPKQATLQNLEDTYVQLGTYYLIKNGYSTKDRARMSDEEFTAAIINNIPLYFSELVRKARADEIQIEKYYDTFHKKLVDMIERIDLHINA